MISGEAINSILQEEPSGTLEESLHKMMTEQLSDAHALPFRHLQHPIGPYMQRFANYIKDLEAIQMDSRPGYSSARIYSAIESYQVSQFKQFHRSAISRAVILPRDKDA